MNELYPTLSINIPAMISIPIQTYFDDMDNKNKKTKKKYTNAVSIKDFKFNGISRYTRESIISFSSRKRFNTLFFSASG